MNTTGGNMGCCVTPGLWIGAEALCEISGSDPKEAFFALGDDFPDQ